MEEQKINVVGYFAGTPDNISQTITDGLIFRVSPVIIFHTEQQHEDILKKVNDRIGNGCNQIIKNNEPPNEL